MRTFRVTEKGGPVAAARVVPDTQGQEIFIISAKAQMQRITLEDVRVTGRNTQGVIVWREREAADFVAAIACFHESDRRLSGDGANGAATGSSNGHRTRYGQAAVADEQLAGDESDGADELLDADDSADADEPLGDDGSN